MSNRHFCEKDQSFLFAKGTHSAGEVIAYIGEAIGREFKAFSSAVNDHIDEDETDPLTPGLYVWEGELSGETGGYTGCGDAIDPDYSFEGAIRPATIEDFAKFGFKEGRLILD